MIIRNIISIFDTSKKHIKEFSFVTQLTGFINLGGKNYFLRWAVDLSRPLLFVKDTHGPELSRNFIITKTQ